MSYSNFINSFRIRNNILRVNNTSLLNISPIRRNMYRENTNNYNFFSSLETIKIGLISKNLIEKSKIKNSEISNKFCVICQDYIEIYNIIRELDCLHEFHIECIDKWFTENKKCPICKYEL